MLSKSSRPKLKLHLQIHELSSIPLVTGQVFVKWHILHSSRGECRGKTDRVPIHDHKAGWSGYKRECTFKVGIGKAGVLQERILIMEVWVEMISGRERVRIGNVGVNLSEYASVKSETRRYLLQESKMNSTVKVTIAVEHVDGSREYTTPPLKKAQMFAGITNLLAENKDIPQIARGIEHHHTKQITRSPTQEMYRRTFAAQWRVQAGELAPRDVVEDLFKGGSGWKSDFAPSVPPLPEKRTRDETRTVRNKDSRQISSRHQLRYQRSNTTLRRPNTPLSPDDASDYDDDDNEDWSLRPDLHSHRMNHLRTSSIVSITPRERQRERLQANVITGEEWEKEELETGRRSWVTPSADVVEEKLAKRRVARESRSTNASSDGSAPSSSGKLSSNQPPSRSTSLNGSIASRTIVEDQDGTASADSSD
jgi:hypothetical protein